MTGWVPLTLAASASRRPPRTLRTWVNRGQVPAVCRLADGAVLVWWPDVFGLTFATERRAPRRRAA